MEELVRYMRAVVLLQIQALQPSGASGGAVKLDILLSRAGFAHKEIAAMLGKTQAAVAKSISRAKAGKQDESDPTTDGASYE